MYIFIVHRISLHMIGDFGGAVDSHMFERNANMLWIHHYKSKIIRLERDTTEKVVRI